MTMVKPELLDVVELLEPLPEVGIPAGSQGTIIFAFATPHEAYEVEFLDGDGRQTAQVTLRPPQFRVSWKATLHHHVADRPH